MRFLPSLLFALLPVGAGVAAVTIPRIGQDAPVDLSWTKTGDHVGDWVLNCWTSPQTSVKRCSIMQQLSDQKSKSVVFARLTGDDGKGNLAGVWQTPTSVLIDRGVQRDVGTDKPIAVPFTACITGHCEAVAALAPDFVEAERATATVFAVSGQGLTFNLSVEGPPDGVTMLKEATADG